ncbi:MAG: GerMN domain-containing protein [Pelosinus sp.]|nr:GerMN domain-containing protein [Pelosinus sp.]
MTKFIHKMLLLLVMLTVSLMVNGCAANTNVSAPPSDNQNNQITQNSTAQSKNPGAIEPGAAGKKAGAETTKITIYHAAADALYLVPEVHVVPRQSANAEKALELLLAGTQSRDLVAVMPQGTKLRGVTIKNHIAYADFSEALVKNHGGGSQTELLIVGAIVNTLTEFPDIQKVQILVDGKKIDTISGHLDSGEPFSRFERLIKKGT